MRVELKVVMEVATTEIYHELRGHQIHEVIAANLKEELRGLDLRGVSISVVEVSHNYAKST